eukprot:TRINITY_DN24917_c0_g1_i1.p1 TRINITY_DN24917_c0_g1~~TRINITY_DN24917_c0_g1_i1.p1  ORF type:complete len:705 (+),score=152.23 TRINITY_DN24917_c0_g1_i1:275-2116(+)
MIRELLLAHPRPVNPGKWILQHLKDHLQAHGTGRPGEHRYIPPKLWVSVGTHGGEHLGGLYRLHSEEVHSMPCWDNGHNWVFSTASGYWLITDHKDKMYSNKGLVSSSSKHGFTQMPHRVSSWQVSDGGMWKDAPVRVSDSLMFETPAIHHTPESSHPNDPGSPPSPHSPSFSPGRWESPASTKPAGAVPGSIFLPGALTAKPVHRLHGDQFESAYASLQGWRAYMEDSTVHKVSRDDSSVSFFMVCDGHGGSEVARHATLHLPDLILSSEDPFPGGEAAAPPPAGDGDGHPLLPVLPHRAVAAAVRELDEDMLSLYHEGGSTSAFVILRSPSGEGEGGGGGDAPYTALVGNIGDSRTVVWGSGQRRVVFETVDHKPDEPGEQRRLREAGYNYGSRLDGNLAVSRAFGDRDEKNVGLIVDPEMVDLHLHRGDVVVIGSDGVFEQLSSSAAASIAVDTLGSSDGDCGAAAAAVCDAALRCGVTDNISCLVLHLTGHPAATSPTVSLPRVECVPGPYTCAWDKNFRDGYLSAVHEGGANLPEALARRYADVGIQLSATREDETSIDAIALRDEFALFHNSNEEVNRLRAARTRQERLNWFESWSQSDAVLKKPHE